MWPRSTCEIADLAAGAGVPGASADGGLLQPESATTTSTQTESCATRDGNKRMSLNSSVSKGVSRPLQFERPELYTIERPRGPAQTPCLPLYPGVRAGIRSVGKRARVCLGLVLEDLVQSGLSTVI